MATIGTIAANLGLNTASFESGIGKSIQSLQSFGSRSNVIMASAANSFNKARKELNDFARDALSLRNIAATVAGASGLGLLIKKSLDFSSSIVDVADSVGLTTTALQEYRYEAALSGVATEKTDAALEKFVANVGELRDGQGALFAQLKQTNPQLLNQLLHVNNTKQALDVYFKAMASATGADQKATLAKAAFGREGVKFTNIVNDNAGGLEAVAKQAHNVGAIIESDLLKQAEAAGDKFDILGMVLKARVVTAVVANAEQLGKLAEKLTNLIPVVIDFVGHVADAAGWLERMAKAANLIPSNKIELMQKSLADVNKEIAANEQLLKKWHDGGLFDFFDPTKTLNDLTGLYAQRKNLERNLDASKLVPAPEEVKKTTETVQNFGAVSNKVFLEAQDKAKETSDEMKKVFENVATTVQHGFSDMFYNIFTGAKGGMKNLAEEMKNVFLKALAEMATLAIAKPIIIPMISAAGAAFGSSDSAAQVAKQFGGSGVASPMSIPGLGGATIGGAIDNFGASYLGTGMMQGPTLTGAPLMGGMSSFSDILSGGGIGSLGASVLGLGNKNPLVNTGAGMAGSYLATLALMGTPLAPFAPFIGGFAGSALSGIFGGGKPSSKLQTGNVDLNLGSSGTVYGRTGLEGKKFSQENFDSVTSIAAFANQFSQAIGGIKDTLQVQVGGRGNSFQFGNEALQSAGTMDELMKGIVSGIASHSDKVSAAFTGALDKIDWKNTTQAVSDLDFAMKFTNLDLAPKKTNALEDALKQLDTATGKAVETAHRLGLEEAVVTKARDDAVKAMQNDFVGGIQNTILQALDPSTISLQQLNGWRDEQLANAKALQTGTLEIEVAYGIQRQKIVQDQQQAMTDTYAAALNQVEGQARDLRLKLQVDKNLSGLSPQNRYMEAASQFQAAQSGYRAGTSDFSAVDSTLTTFLEASKDYWGESTNFFQDQASGLDFLKTIEGNTNAANDNQKALVDAMNSGSNLLLNASNQANSILSVILSVLQQQGGAANQQQYLRAGENASILSTTNAANGISELAVRQAKTIAGFNFADPKNANRSFADAVRAGDASASIFNAIVTGEGGKAQKFSKGGYAHAGVSVVNERGIEMALLGQDSRIFNASDTRNIMANDNSTLEEGINELNSQLGYSRLQEGASNQRVIELLEELTAAAKQQARARERR